MLTELSIIIPTLNEEKYLPHLLTSISRQNFGGKLEVIVVDGHSEDSTIAVAERFYSKISQLSVISVARGISHQRNSGADRALYDTILFLDADIVLPDNFLNNLAKKINISERFIDYSLHLPIKPNLGDYLFVICAIAYLHLSWLVLEEPLLGGSFILTTKENHRRIGGFAVGAIIGEDYDYLRRSLEDGAIYHLHYKPHVLVSPRRARSEGRVHLMLKWLRCYLYIRKQGKPIYNEEKFTYNYGHFHGDE